MNAEFDSQPAAFDELAADYDDTFTERAVGRLLRAAVWRRLDANFRPGDYVLELNCGTGADAVYLAQRGVRVLATDISAAMLDATRAKVMRTGVSDLVSVARLDIEQLAAPQSPAQGARVDIEQLAAPQSPVHGAHADLEPLAASFDGALSNFGGLNCVADLTGVGRALAAWLRPGAHALLCVMGPLTPWEWAWYARRGQMNKAFRRLRRAGVAWHGLTIRYPSIRALRQALAPAFALARVNAIGALLPPSYAEPWAAQHPRALAWLDRAERRLETVWPLPWLADHYLAEFVRVG